MRLERGACVRSRNHTQPHATARERPRSPEKHSSSKQKRCSKARTYCIVLCFTLKSATSSLKALDVCFAGTNEQRHNAC